MPAVRGSMRQCSEFTGGWMLVVSTSGSRWHTLGARNILRSVLIPKGVLNELSEI